MAILKITVSDYSSDTPIEDAIVLYDEMPFHTNASGVTTISGSFKTRDAVILECQKDGYDTRKRKFILSNIKNYRGEDVFDLEIQLKQSSGLDDSPIASVPSSTPPPRKRGFLEKIFGGEDVQKERAKRRTSRTEGSIERRRLRVKGRQDRSTARIKGRETKKAQRAREKADKIREKADKAREKSSDAEARRLEAQAKIADIEARRLEAEAKRAEERRLEAEAKANAAAPSTTSSGSGGTTSSSGGGSGGTGGGFGGAGRTGGGGSSMSGSNIPSGGGSGGSILIVINNGTKRNAKDIKVTLKDQNGKKLQSYPISEIKGGKKRRFSVPVKGEGYYSVSVEVEKSLHVADPSENGDYVTRQNIAGNSPPPKIEFNLVPGLKKKYQKEMKKYKKEMLDDFVGGGEGSFTSENTTAEQRNKAMEQWENHKKSEAFTNKQEEVLGELGAKRHAKRLKYKKTGLYPLASSVSGHGPHIQNVIFSVALVGVGIVLTSLFGSGLFMLGFIFIALYLLFPNPDNFQIPKSLKNYMKQAGSPANALDAFKFSAGLWISKEGRKVFWRNKHTTYGSLKTIFKLGAMVCFVWGIFQSNNIPFVNVVLLLVTFAFYYSLKIEWSPEKPYEIIESTLRFGFGLVVIPFLIILPIFGSLLLAFIAVAFFGLGAPPIPAPRKEESGEGYAVSDLLIRMGFAAIMVGVLVGYFLGWGTGTSETLDHTFVYFWFVTGIAGVFSNVQGRPALGFIMLTVALVIYGVGPGSQEFGQALFGQWYPTIQNGLSDLGKPLESVFGSLRVTFGSAFTLLTDPIGYAQQIANGTYSTDPDTGLAGALGVEIEELRVTPIYPDSSFNVIWRVANKGSEEAINVKAKINAGMLSVSDKSTIGDFGFESVAGGQDCYPQPLGHDAEVCELNLGIAPNYKIPKLGVEQIFFQSKGLSCKTIVDNKLRNRAIPLNISIEYDYKIDSTVNLEVISIGEWSRKATEGTLQVETKKPSTLTNSPARLNLDVPGQPMREGTNFWIGLNLVSSQPRGKITKINGVVIEYPAIFGDSLEPSCSGVTTTSGAIKTMTFNNIPEHKVIYCPFAGTVPLLGAGGSKVATKTFVIKGSATFKFEKSDYKNTKVEFGGVICCDSSSDCPTGQTCDGDNVCVGAGTSP